MFELLKRDVKIGDNIVLFLTTGKEINGVVLELEVNYILIEIGNGKKNTFFDKIIGGWEVISSQTNLENKRKSKLTIKPAGNIINKRFLLKKISLLKESLGKNILNKFIRSNADIIDVHADSCLINDIKNSRIINVKNSKIADPKLISKIKVFKSGETIQVVLTSNKNGLVTAISLPNTLDEFLNILSQFVTRGNYIQASLLLYPIENEIRYNKNLIDVINELKRVYEFEDNPEILNKNLEIDNEGQLKNYKDQEKFINDLMRQSKFEFALSQIKKELKNMAIDDKYRSRLLLKRAQIYSSMNDPISSEKAYQELVVFNEKINAPANNLSHLYTELARLQSLNPEKQAIALETAKKALSYNKNNNYATVLLKQFEGRFTGYTEHIYRTKNEDHLIIEADDDNVIISKMIDLDIKEHKYSHPEIIKNGGKATAFIAKLILDDAKNTKEDDLSERYPAYLEAAKAFNELNIGSYDLQDYLESAAYYSMLKGNSLLINFRNRIYSGEYEVLKLTRLKDSACSYYIESLHLLSNIDSSFLTAILGNYLKLNLAVYYLRSNTQIKFTEIFKGSFAAIFKYCIKNEGTEIEAMAYRTIVDCGASSINAWNNLNHNKNGTKVLYSEFINQKRSKEIFDLINSIERTNISSELKPGEFLKRTFFERRNSVKKFMDNISHLFSIDMEPHNIDNLIKSWKSIEDFEVFMTPTDNEVKREIENIIQILQPYLNRSDKERVNILIQVRKIIEKEIKFINENTTFYGRTFFYTLLNKWKREVDLLFEEKIAQSYPALKILVDPPYYVNSDAELTAQLVIKNEGEATAEGFDMTVMCRGTKSSDEYVFKLESDKEIASEGKIETFFVIPVDILSDSKAVEIKIEIHAVYQKKKLTSKKFDFTIEEEPKNSLTYDDIVWRDGPIPPEYLFKGRRKLIANLAQHYLSIEKDKPYILYGLTRTGKSSVLEYLKKDLEGDTFISKSKEMTVLTFSWDFSEAASFKKASDFWEYILLQKIVEQLEEFSVKYKFELDGLLVKNNVRAKDFKIILDFLKSKNLYPIIFVDEFSFIKTLIDDKTVNAAFLHSLRQYSLGELASFIFAGTYDIKSLIVDSKYGITGQLVNAIEEQINEINDEAAEDLILVMKDKLSFTMEAIEHIKFLSGNVPYFIQIICKFCGYYASENRRRYIGYPELEKVIRILIGQEQSSNHSLIKKLSENMFQNNQFSPTDEKEVSVLISSIAYLNKNRINDPRGIGFSELQELWAEKKIFSYGIKLAGAISLLLEKKILIQEEDEGLPVYKLSVDLFRRWWENSNPDINLTLSTLID